MATINKQALIEFIADYNFDDNCTHTKKRSGEFLADLIELITSAVANGDEVSIPGFGKFYQFTSSTTGKKSPKFIAFKDFKDLVSPK